MGTHASTRVKVGSTVVVSMYRHYDGYGDGHGQELAKFLLNKHLVNGLSGETDDLANGMDDLAAQIVSHFKKESGGFYLSPIDNTEEYDYLVYEKNNEIRIKMTCEYDEKQNFDGTPRQLLEFVGVKA